MTEEEAKKEAEAGRMGSIWGLALGMWLLTFIDEMTRVEAIDKLLELNPNEKEKVYEGVRLYDLMVKHKFI